MSKEVMRVTLDSARVMDACGMYVAMQSAAGGIMPKNRTFSALDVPSDLSITVVIREKRVRKAKAITVFGSGGPGGLIGAGGGGGK